MNRSTTLTVTVLEPKEKNIADITDEHIQRLDRDGLISLIKELQGSLLSYLDSEPLNSAGELKTITRNKGTQAWHQWEDKHLKWLNKEASTGRSIHSILGDIQKHWHDATIGGITAQLAKMGYSVLRGIPVPKSKKKLVLDDIKKHSGLTLEEEIEIIKSFAGEVS